MLDTANFPRRCGILEDRSDLGLYVLKFRRKRGDQAQPRKRFSAARGNREFHGGLKTVDSLFEIVCRSDFSAVIAKSLDPLLPEF